MDEQFFHYLWKFRLLNPDLRLTTGESITILNPGDYNHDGGPDFFNARIRIGTTTWAGNVEIHGKSSDWFRHGHQHDKAYDTIILHVVYQQDKEIRSQNNDLIPTLELKGQYPEALSLNYRSIILSQQWIPCYSMMSVYPKHEFSLWAPGLVMERLQQKMRGICSLWESCGKDWEEALYRYLSLSFGFRINGLPFELLAKSLPLKIIIRHGDELFRKEALLFGMSGLVGPGLKDDYPLALQSEFEYLSKKYNLHPIPKGLWKHLRLRPSNFPCIRISQWAAFLNHNRGNLFNMLEVNDVMEWTEKFGVVASEYWDDHFTFDRLSPHSPKEMGTASIYLLIINALVPFLFFYSNLQGNPGLAEKALLFLDQLPGETNAEIKEWAKAGMPVKTALNTQALLHLKRHYCDAKRCLECRIGNRILKAESHEKERNDQGLPVL